MKMLISYDLRTTSTNNRSEDYDAIDRFFEQFYYSAKISGSTWILDTAKYDSFDVYYHLASTYLKADDSLIVSKITKNTYFKNTISNEEKVRQVLNF